MDKGCRPAAFMNIFFAADADDGYFSFLPVKCFRDERKD